MFTGVRGVSGRDLDAVRDLIARDPVANCFLDGRVAIAGVDPWRLGGDLWGYVEDDRLVSLLYCGANLVPVSTTPAARAAFAARLRQSGRRCSSFVGPADEVLDLWRLLEPAWGPAREVRTCQPLLAIDRDPGITADPQVRRTTPAEIDRVLPACVDMFTEEVGVSPVAGGTGAAYRARILDLIRAGRSFVRMDGGEVLFKAEVGAVSTAACQVQGVWVAHAMRGHGLAAPALAAVVQEARASIAPVVSLYVNDFNTAARKAYARVGFEQVGEFATVLF